VCAGVCVLRMVVVAVVLTAVVGSVFARLFGFNEKEMDGAICECIPMTS
jgi:hypothetical protein